MFIRVLTYLTLVLVFPLIVLASDNCPASEIGSLQFSQNVNLCSMSNDFDNLDGFCAGSTREAIFAFEPSEQGEYFLYVTHLNDTSFAEVRLSFRYSGDCPGDSLNHCVDIALAPMGTQQVALGEMTAGQRLYILVENSPWAACTYVNIFVNGYLEGESPGHYECLQEYPFDSLNAMFDCNGGCVNEDNGGNFAAEPAELNSLIFGSAFKYQDFDGVAVDFDFFSYVIPDPSQLLLSILPEFTAQVSVFRGTDCSEPIYTFVTPPNPGEFEWQLIECIAGTDVLVQVNPLNPAEFAYGEIRNYVLLVDSLTCPECNYVNETISAPGSAILDSTCILPNNCNYRNSQDVTAQIFIPHDGLWKISMCATTHPWDAVMHLSESCCGLPLLGQGIGECGNGLPEIITDDLGRGNYFVTIEGQSLNDCGSVQLSVSELTRRCCYGPENAPLCADLTQLDCQSLAGVWSSWTTCAEEPCSVRPLCDREGGISQPPHVPAESYNFESTIAFWNEIDGAYENYALGEPVAVVQFWAQRTATGSDCIESETSVRLSFHTTPTAAATCAYDLNLSGVLLPYSWGSRDVYEFTAVLPELCELTSGFVRVQSLTDTCSLLWLSSPFGDGEAVSYSFGFPTALNYDLSLCLSGTPEVVINEVMYDDTANNDIEWVELHNTRDVQQDVSNWILSDGGTWPPPSTEGAIQIPPGTTIAPNGYLVIGKLALPGIPSVVCPEIDASWALANGGDNLELYRDTTSTSLVDGALNLNHPDLAPGNTGTSVEKCMEDVAWTNDTTVWSASSHAFSPTGRYRFCTPGARNSCVAMDPCLPPDSVTIKWNTAGQAEIHFISDGGTYDIFSTDIPNNDGDPRGGDPQWAQRATLFGPAGITLWTDTDVTSAYRNYVVLKVCP